MESAAPRVAHLRRDRYDVRVDRQSPWGNPFRIGDLHPTYCGYPDKMTRAEVIDHYRDWLQHALIKHPDFLEPLRGKVLGCWCRPKAGFQGQLLCHAQVIVGHLEGIDPATVE